jgi:hypothetical protein
VTFPPEGRFTAQKLKDWLSGVIESGAPIIIGRVPDSGRFIKITLGGSAGGLQVEGLFDAPTFQIQCRGGENNYEDAEAIAYEIDSVMIGAPNNFMMGDVYVQTISRVGGAPQSLQLTDAQSRYVFTCNYYAIASTGV